MYLIGALDNIKESSYRGSQKPQNVIYSLTHSTNFAAYIWYHYVITFPTEWVHRVKSSGWKQSSIYLLNGVSMRSYQLRILKLLLKARWIQIRTQVIIFFSLSATNRRELPCQPLRKVYLQWSFDTLEIKEGFAQGLVGPVSWHL